MNLFEASSKQIKDVYFTRKRCYAIHLQTIVDHHDIAKVFKNSSLRRYRNQLFEETDYILADSAYPPSPNIIPLFKNPSGLEIEFNKKNRKPEL